ncbi:MAG: hypothetical protein K1Y01_07105 [Vicinamibacteria bacterium]|nr:hypothetical protein [Vicinamibacteria bacterium]
MKPSRTASVLFVGLAFGCVQAKPATDTGGINASSSTSSVSGPSAVSTPTPATTPSTGAATPTPTPTTGVTLAYTPDLQPIFASDCLVCHSDRNPLGRYSMSSYTAVMKAVTPGSASSTLVRVTQSNGSMYRYWSGDRQAKATKTRDWVVTNRAAQTR